MTIQLAIFALFAACAFHALEAKTDWRRKK
jgi:hypothetical protein